MSPHAHLRIFAMPASLLTGDKPLPIPLPSPCPHLLSSPSPLSQSLAFSLSPLSLSTRPSSPTLPLLVTIMLSDAVSLSLSEPLSLCLSFSLSLSQFHSLCSVLVSPNLSPAKEQSLSLILAYTTCSSPSYSHCRCNSWCYAFLNPLSLALALCMPPHRLRNSPRLQNHSHAHSLIAHLSVFSLFVPASR